MTMTRGQPMRQLGSMSLFFAIVVGAVAQTVPATEAAQTCFGKPATIADHSGSINGTAGNDVIVGDNGDNEIDGQGGVDRICGGDGDDEIVAGGPGRIQRTPSVPKVAPAPTRSTAGPTTTGSTAGLAVTP